MLLVFVFRGGPFLLNMRFRLKNHLGLLLCLLDGHNLALFGLELSVGLSHVILQDGNSLLVEHVLGVNLLHQFLDERVLLHNNAVHGHTNSIQPLIQHVLIVSQLVDLRSYLAILRVDLTQKLLDFAHHIVECLLATTQFSCFALHGLLGGD